MSPQLLICIRTDPAPTLVTVAGEIDIATVRQFREQLLAMPDGDVILDVSRVGLLAAAGLRTLLDLHDHRARAGARLVLVAPAPGIRRVLGVTGLGRTLPMAVDAAHAAALLSGPPTADRTG